MECIFCKIIAGDIPAKKLYEDEFSILIKDIDPKAPQHYLFIPKSHFADMHSADFEQLSAVKHMLSRLKSVAALLKLDNGYRLVINKGDDGGQSVPHLHIHILGGKKLGWNPG